MSAYIEITNLTKRYGATCALDGVSVAVARGSTLALLGPNGAGKSTLFGCLLGLTAPTSGEIRLEGMCSNRRGSNQLWLCSRARRALSAENSRRERGIFRPT